jgi:transcriptional regulator with XRE-family HTH domain
MTTAEEFAARLRRLREDRGMTRYRLAKLAGVTVEGVSKLEQGGTDPKLSTILKLAGGLGVPPCQLLPGTGHDEAEKPTKGKAAGRRRKADG